MKKNNHKNISSNTGVMRHKHRILLLVLFALVGSIILSQSFAANNTSGNDVGILYATKEGSDTAQIYRADLNGENSRKLSTDNNSEQEWARPSPDGKKILFMKADKGSSVNFAVESNRLWIMDVDGSNQREIISINKRNSYGWNGMAHAEWSPDSSKIVLVATLPTFTSQLYVVDINGNNPEQISKTKTIDGQTSNVVDPSWSSSNQIMYVRTWNCLILCGNHDVFKMDYASREETRITNDANWNYDPYISPDGKTYLWLSFRSSNIMCPCDLIKGNVFGSLNPANVIADGGANANGTFSSDSKRILFLKQVGLKQVLHRINSDGSGLTKLGNGETGVASFIPAVTSSNNPNNSPTQTGSGTTQNKPGNPQQNTPPTTENSINVSSNNPSSSSSTESNEENSTNSSPIAKVLPAPVSKAILSSPITKQIKRNPFYAMLGIIAGITLVVIGGIMLRNNLQKNNSFKTQHFFR